MSQTVIGIFENPREANEAVQNLVNQGFNREDIDLAQNSSSSASSTSHHDDDEGFGSSISNFFKNLFDDDDDRANNYSEVAKRCSTITVHTRSEDQAERAADILDNCGAVDVDEKASQYRSNNFTGASDMSDRSDYNTDETNVRSDYNRDETTNRSIPVIEENMEVGKREVENGGVRVRSHIVEKPVEESVRLRSEHVNVERNPVNREASSADFDAFEEGTIEMTEHKEVPVVNKQAWVKEEISLNKEVEEREETIHDTVRKTEVDIDNIDEHDDVSSRPNFYNENTDMDDDDNDTSNRDRNRDI
ncbi:MAG: hypothetical protein K0S09_565 [Sphingobacteriaceae bacterium]|jgi:uncharacterized protein (TIGR02271 family)|nr:hypothetical protein [Sphingobacteriaceae bacterium]